MDVSPEQLLEHAKERFELQDYFGAIHLLEDLIATGEAFADAYHLLGLSYYFADQPEQALQELDRALELNPRYVNANVHRGIVLNELGRSEEAEIAFATARQSRGEDRRGIPRDQAANLANRHAELGDAYAEAGALSEAIGQYETAMELGPTFHDLRYRLARLLLDASRSLEAREQLEKVVEARPRFADGKSALGLACYLSGDAQTAREIWSRLAAEAPSDPRPAAYLAMLDRESGDP